MKKLCHALISILKKASTIVLDQLKDPKIALFLFTSTALLLFLPQSILTPLGIHAFIEGKRRLIGLIFFYSIKCFLAIAVFWVLVQVKRRIQSKRLAQNGRPALHDLTPGERKLLAGFVVQDTKIQYYDDRDDIIDRLISNNILFLTSHLSVAESKLNCIIHSWAWKELKKYPELLEPELSDHGKNTLPG